MNRVERLASRYALALRDQISYHRYIKRLFALRISLHLLQVISASSTGYLCIFYRLFLHLLQVISASSTGYQQIGITMPKVNVAWVVFRGELPGVYTNM